MPDPRDNFTGQTWSDHLITEAERLIASNPGPCADFMRLLASEYRIAVKQALRLEKIVHEATKGAE